MKPIRRVLIANRGEIALRIIRACRELGVETVLAASEADRESLPARAADRTLCIGPPAPAESYLKVNTLMVACQGSGADALHPGYGFLSEQPALAEACQKAGVVFVGPTPANLREMGNKLVARRLAADCGVPTLAGSAKVSGAEEAVGVAEKMGFPVALKAAAGGGGRGMRIVRDAAELRDVFPVVSAEVRTAFGDETLYVENFVPDARHVEVQVLGDQQGAVIHLGERDCTIQRRFQKVIEEGPSPAISDRLRTRLHKAAVALAKTMKYRSAGTVEFLVDQATEQFYFLEMNARIQVEHPVTEAVTGVDLVCAQIRIAAGEPLGMKQAEVTPQGHALECRINAESPERGFQPTPGRLTTWREPRGEGIRVDTHCYEGYFVPPYYDSLLAKVIAHGANRAQAISRMLAALADFSVAGVDTNLAFHQKVLRHPDFQSGRTHTRWLEEVFLGGWKACD